MMNYNNAAREILILSSYSRIQNYSIYSKRVLKPSLVYWYYVFIYHMEQFVFYELVLVTM
jgi:hypothetical protein